jgi:hypothetical protein
LIIGITTLYCGPRTRTGKRRGQEGTGRYPELAALGIRKGATPALQSRVGRLTALLPSIELARDEVRQQGPTLDEKAVHRMARQLGAEVLTARTRVLQQYREGRLPAGHERRFSREPVIAKLKEAVRPARRRPTRRRTGPHTHADRDEEAQGGQVPPQDSPGVAGTQAPDPLRQ